MNNPIIPEQTLNGLCDKYANSRLPIAKDLRAFHHYIASAVDYYESLSKSQTSDLLKYHYHQRAMVYRRVLTGMPEEVEE